MLLLSWAMSVVISIDYLSSSSKETIVKEPLVVAVAVEKIFERFNTFVIAINTDCLSDSSS